MLCALSDLSATSSGQSGRSEDPEELMNGSGVEEDAGLIGLGVKFVTDLAAFPSGEVRELGEIEGIAGDVTALWLEFPGAVGRPFPRAATLFPYSSRLFVEPASSGGGAAIPKLLRGIGTPPFLSNLAILSRRLPRGGAREASRGGVEDGVGEGEPLYC